MYEDKIGKEFDVRLSFSELRCLIVLLEGGVLFSHSEDRKRRYKRLIVKLSEFTGDPLPVLAYEEKYPDPSMS